MLHSLRLYLLPAFAFIYLQSYSQNSHEEVTGYAYTLSANISAIRQVDSISYSNGKGRPFAVVYRESMKNISLQAQTMDSSLQNFVLKFETTFAAYFLDACFDNEAGTLPKNSEWTCFFNTGKTPSWKKILLGVNTHINIDIWPSLVKNFSAKQIRENKKQFLSLQPSIVKVYDQVFDTLLAHSGYMRFISFVTFRLNKKLGERILYKWRKRNMNLAIWHSEKPKKFERKWKAVQRKKKKTDKIILRSGPKKAKA
jgi:hypothetical protein